MLDSLITAPSRVGPVDLLDQTTRIVAAYLTNNPLAISELPAVLQVVHASLAGLGQPAEPEAPAQRVPAVPIRKSVTPDYLVCLEDGKKLKMLKRHLRTSYDLTPEEYRARWNLPADYPMVARTYAERRSQFAKAIGLGRRRPAELEPKPAPVTKGRRKVASSPTA
jgi:predicted transcriptional regulator